MKKKKTYKGPDENENPMIVCEPAASLANKAHAAQSLDLSQASVLNGVLQVTPDLEEEILEAESGETVSMEEFKTMFAKWLEQ